MPPPRQRLRRCLFRWSLVATSLTAIALVALASDIVVRESSMVRPWGTLGAGLLLIGGSMAAMRGRTLGLLLTTATAVSLVGVVAFDIAPTWFLGVAAVATMPLLVAMRPMMRFDALAAVVAVALATLTGIGAAVIAGPGLDPLLEEPAPAQPISVPYKVMRPCPRLNP